jgi:hypothetical protein
MESEFFKITKIRCLLRPITSACDHPFLQDYEMPASRLNHDLRATKAIAKPPNGRCVWAVRVRLGYLLQKMFVVGGYHRGICYSTAATHSCKKPWATRFNSRFFLWSVHSLSMVPVSRFSNALFSRSPPARPFTPETSHPAGTPRCTDPPSTAACWQPAWA